MQNKQGTDYNEIIQQQIQKDVARLQQIKMETEVHLTSVQEERQWIQKQKEEIQELITEFNR